MDVLLNGIGSGLSVVRGGMARHGEVERKCPSRGATVDGGVALYGHVGWDLNHRGGGGEVGVVSGGVFLLLFVFV